MTSTRSDRDDDDNDDSDDDDDNDDDDDDDGPSTTMTKILKKCDDTKFEKVARDWDGANTFTLQIPRS